MIAVLLSALFTTSALLAAATIAASWLRYGRAALALRGELAACGEWREARVRMSEITVRPSATVLRPNFTAAAQAPLGRPSRPSALPAAA